MFQRSGLYFLILLFGCGAAAEGAAEAIPMPVCDRTEQVREEILKEAGKTDCSQITDADLRAIVSLDLEEKWIVTLKYKDFSGLTSLERLDLSHNKLRSFPVEVIGLTSLDTLSLSFNPLIYLQEELFSGLTSLEHISLAGTQLTYELLPDGMFELPSLQSFTFKKHQLWTTKSGKKIRESGGGLYSNRS